jgi:hypothetical protein
MCNYILPERKKEKKTRVRLKQDTSVMTETCVMWSCGHEINYMIKRKCCHVVIGLLPNGT